MDCLPDVTCLGKPPNCKLQQMCRKKCKKDNKFIDKEGNIDEKKKEEFTKCMKGCDGKTKRKLQDIFDFIKKDPRYTSSN